MLAWLLADKGWDLWVENRLLFGPIRLCEARIGIEG